MNRSTLVALASFALLGCPPPPLPMNDAGDGGGTPTDGGGLAGTAYCTGAAPACTRPAVANCGVCVTPPEDSANDRLVRTSCATLSENPDFCDNGMPARREPNLSCYTDFNPAAPPQLEESRRVTLWGVVDVFGTGGDSNNIRVQVFDVAADGSPGTMIGEATSDTTGMRFRNCTETEVERNTSGMEVQRRTLGCFRIDNVPTERPVIVRTQGDPNFFGHALYDYTLPIRNRDIGRAPPPAELGITGPSIKIRPRTLANADWTTIPSLAALPTGIPAGHGALAGEVHDCDDVRLSFATVYSTPAPHLEGAVYLSDNDTRPLPDNSRSNRGTGILGIYALLDLDPGPVTVSAMGYVGGGPDAGTEARLVHAGSYRARIFPDSITVVTLRGLRPWQVAGR